MFRFTDDPVEDFARWDAEQNRLLQKLPVCSECEEPVQDDYFYLINDEVICPSCMKKYRRWTDDYVE